MLRFVGAINSPLCGQRLMILVGPLVRGKPPESSPPLAKLTGSPLCYPGVKFTALVGASLNVESCIKDRGDQSLVFPMINS